MVKPPMTPLFHVPRMDIHSSEATGEVGACSLHQWELLLISRGRAEGRGDDRGSGGTSRCGHRPALSGEHVLGARTQLVGHWPPGGGPGDMGGNASCRGGPDRGPEACAWNRAHGAGRRAGLSKDGTRC